MNSNRRIMYKFECGGNSSVLRRKEQQDVKNRNRKNNRQNAYIKNRLIEIIPENTPKQNHHRSKNITHEKQFEGKISKLNIQKAFREKFKNYIEKKALTKTNEVKPKPFISAVAKHRIINVSKTLKSNNSNIKRNLREKFEFNSYEIAMQRDAANTKRNLRKRQESDNKSKIAGRQKLQPYREIDILNSKSIKKHPQKICTPSKMLGVKSTEAYCADDFVTSTAVKTKRQSVRLKKICEQISSIENLKSENADTKKAIVVASVHNNINFESPSSKEQEKCTTREILNDSSNGEKLVNYVSPYVTISRGGRRSESQEIVARNLKYTLKSRGAEILDQSVEQRQNAEAARYFRQQLEKTTDHLNMLMSKWYEMIKDKIKSIPNECIDLINVAIGQTKLLINSKFKQFSSLITECENNKKKKSFPHDLEGFWSLVYIQVENCNYRFEKLESLKNNDWINFEDAPKEKKIQKKNAMVNKHKITTKRQASESLSKMLMEARKKVNESKFNYQCNQKNINMVRTITPSKPIWVRIRLNNKNH